MTGPVHTQTGNAEKVGEQVTTFTAAHPPRSDSPEYVASRKWLMGTPGGCYICGGPVDLSHPGGSQSKGQEDHHGGGLIGTGDVLVGFNLFPLEWSMGWGADPVRVNAFVQQLAAAKLIPPHPPILTTDDVMAWVDSRENANVKLCAVHHRATQHQHTPDVNGHEAVGIHNAPWPILAAQATCDWSRWDMWLGTSGTAMGAFPRADGSVLLLHADPIAHPELHAELSAGEVVLSPAHPMAREAAQPKVPSA